ncbi:MAG: 3',5'-cyclic AMP phosphodiesterase CpdA [Akkermansiaceae bacterium]|jgi:3',5'-cyclic AMP phosphodiesterase CpdA
MMNRRQFLSASVAAGVSATSSKANSGPKDLHPAISMGLAKAKKDLPRTAKLKVAGDELRILQFTDIHFFCDRKKYGEKADLKSVEDMKRMVENTDPHLIAITGDLWSDNPRGKGQEFFEYALEKVESLGKPWLFNWGNHDQLDDYATAQATLTEAKNSLYRGGHDGGNYRIPITGADDRQLWELLCLNTTTQGVQATQEKWLTAQKPSSSPVLCFLHIPLLEYDTVWQKKLAKGIFKEPVCTYGEDGSALSVLKKFGDVKACFCGHDHVNDFGGTWDGVEMVYGRATGHAGYGGDKLKKGGKLITVNLTAPQNPSYAWKTVFADGSDWSPE